MRREALRLRSIEEAFVEVGLDEPPGVMAFRPLEVWRQDPQDDDLWHGDNGVIVNGAALRQREAFFDVVRLRNTATTVGG